MKILIDVDREDLGKGQILCYGERPVSEHCCRPSLELFPRGSKLYSDQRWRRAQIESF